MARYMALLERFPHGLEFQCCEKLSPTSQYAARKVAQEWAKERAEERQIRDFVAVLYTDYYNDPTPRYQTHVNVATTATIRECIEALGNAMVNLEEQHRANLHADNDGNSAGVATD